jgi:hypothetical protein
MTAPTELQRASAAFLAALVRELGVARAADYLRRLADDLEAFAAVVSRNLITGEPRTAIS